MVAVVRSDSLASEASNLHLRMPGTAPKHQEVSIVVITALILWHCRCWCTSVSAASVVTVRQSLLLLLAISELVESP